MKEHYHRRHRHGSQPQELYHSRIRRRDALRAAAVCGCILLLLLVAVWSVQRWEDKTYASSAETTVHAVQEKQSHEDLTYQGTVYTPKEQTAAYLFMGIDVSGPVVSRPGNYNGGQADAQFLLVVDDAKETWQLLRLNRDSMVDVPVLGLKGEVVGYEHQQLALAHAYGDGTEMSCMNVVNTVSELLGGQEIEGYASLNMDGIAVLNDAVGGVTVTILSDFTAVDPTLVEGKTVTLTGEQAMTFVRSRANVDDQTNLARMERQMQYLEAMKPQFLALEDADVIRLYDALSDYLVTDLGSKNFLELAEKLQTYQELPVLVIEGESTIQDGHVAYILNEESIQQVMLELFYQKK